MDAKSKNASQKEYAVEITTSPDFIEFVGKKLYTNPLLAILCRELVQNSRDATSYPYKGSIKLSISQNEMDNTTSVICDDTGCGMDEDTLVNTFLQIGGTKKAEGSNSVGGFGVAKVSIFATGSWSVHTLDNYVDTNRIFKKMKKIRGTYIVCRVSHKDEWKRRNDNRLAELFVKSCNIRNLTLNGKKIRAYKPRKLIDLYKGAQIYSAPKLDGYANKIFWRIRGLTQFISDIGYGDDYGFNVVVDFDAIGYKPKSDEYPFDVAREKVNDEYVQAVRSAIAPLAKNVLTARKTYAREKVYRERIQHRAKSSAKSYIIVDAPKNVELVDRQIMQLWREVLEGMGIRNAKFGMTYEASTVAEHRTGSDGEYFLINPTKIRSDWNSLTVYSAKFSIPLIWSTWHLAVHEMTHRQQSDHDEHFTSLEHLNAVQTSISLSVNVSKIIPQARKVLKGIVELNSK